MVVMTVRCGGRADIRIQSRRVPVNWKCNIMDGQNKSTFGDPAFVFLINLIGVVSLSRLTRLTDGTSMHVTFGRQQES
jgi:hypothetical protein